MSAANVGAHHADAHRNSATDDGAVYVVSTPYGPEQVFSCRADADHYAVGRPGASVSRHRLRRSVDEAVVIHDRRVVVTRGEPYADQSSSILQFDDDPFFISGPADVESYCGEGDRWHIVGFGTDEHALSARMTTAIDSACRLSDSSYATGAR